jgi:hypothetical protein
MSKSDYAKRELIIRELDKVNLQMLRQLHCIERGFDDASAFDFASVIELLASMIVHPESDNLRDALSISRQMREAWETYYHNRQVVK